MKSQHVSKRFYSRITQWICPKVSLPLKPLGYTELMKQQTSRVMIFYRHGSFFTFSDSLDFNWQANALVVVNSDTDYSNCPTEWPKNCQISTHE